MKISTVLVTGILGWALAVSCDVAVSLQGRPV